MIDLSNYQPSQPEPSCDATLCSEGSYGPDELRDEQRLEQAILAGKRDAQSQIATSRVNPSKLAKTINQANEQIKKHHYEEAIALLSKSAKEGHHSAIVGLAKSYLKLSRIFEAARHASHALEKKKDCNQSLNVLGLCAAKLSLWEPSLAYFDQGLLTAPKNTNLLINRADSLKRLGRFEQAFDSVNAALLDSPKNELALYTRANLHALLGDTQAAMRDFDAIDPSLAAQSPINYSSTLTRNARPAQSIAVIDNAKGKVTKKEWYDLLLNKSSAQTHLGFDNEAYATLNDAIELDPSKAIGYWNLAVVLLGQGNFEFGWEFFEKRFDAASTKPAFPAITKWDGRDSLAGKHLLIVHEQGIGDSIQFCRYALDILALGATVTLQVPRGLASLAQSLHPELRIITEVAPDYAEQEGCADYYIALMSLPFALKTGMESIPNPGPYLRPGEKSVQQWRDKLNQDEDKIQVGLVWRGNPDHTNDINRSMALEQLTPLFTLAHCHWHIIQQDLSSSERDWLNKVSDAGSSVTIYDQQLHDFEDTAGLMSGLDRVVCVDTSVAHLAGAINTPVTLLLSKANDYRWLRQGSTSPWYSSATLVRQTTLGQWDEVIEQVRAQLLVNNASASPADQVSEPDQRTPEPSNQEAAGETSVNCKVCQGSTSLFGVADFSKNCEQRRGTYLPVAGVPIYYRQCQHCKLLFTDAFDDWAEDDFAANIYNDDYVKVDPDYQQVRPSNLAQTVADFALKTKYKCLLDYGGGQGLMAKILREKGLSCESWDPFGGKRDTPKAHHYDLVTCFEVFEHTPTPVKTVRAILGHLKPGGALLFSTLALDNLPNQDVSHWYISPRNGHITIHTLDSLKKLFAGFGWHVHHFSNGMHLAFKDKPSYLTA